MRARRLPVLVACSERRHAAEDRFSGGTYFFERIIRDHKLVRWGMGAIRPKIDTSRPVALPRSFIYKMRPSGRFVHLFKWMLTVQAVEIS
jgi:hypothetical protein